MRKSQKNFLIGCGFAILALFVALVIIPTQVQTTKNVIDFQPTFFPYFSCYLIAGLSIYLAVSSLRKDHELIKDLLPNVKQLFNRESVKTARNVVIVFLLFWIYYFLFVTVGFILSTVLVLPVFMFLMGWRRPVVALLTTAVVIIALYYFFNEIMLLRLP